MGTEPLRNWAMDSRDLPEGERGELSWNVELTRDRGKLEATLVSAVIPDIALEVRPRDDLRDARLPGMPDASISVLTLSQMLYSLPAVESVPPAGMGRLFGSPSELEELESSVAGGFVNSRISGASAMATFAAEALVLDTRLPRIADFCV